MNEDKQIPEVKPLAPLNPKISYDDFAKVEIKAGKILSAEKIPDTDKLLKLSVDFAEDKPRQIVSGISMYFPDPAVLVGKICMFVTNLEPRMIKGFESNGMLFALSTTDGNFSLLEPSSNIPVGTKAK
jgi:methionyl-tRNA synthetase